MARHIAWYARRTPDETAIVENDALITYRAMANDLVRCVRAIEAIGVRPGILVGIESPRRYPHLLLLLSCEVIGATTTSLPPDLADDIAQRCDLVLASNTNAARDFPNAIAIPPGWPASLAQTTPAADEDLTALEIDVAPDHPARIVRTSGTTGAQKAMVVTQRNQMLRATRCILRAAGEVLPIPRFLSLYSLTVSNVYWRVLGVLQYGGTVLFALRKQASPLIGAGAVNYTIFSVGDLERFVDDAVAAPPGRPARLEVFGARLNAALRHRAQDQLNVRVTSFYSTNETSPIAVMNDDNVGTLCDGIEVRIVDAAGRELPHGEAGTIQVRGVTSVEGYYNDPGMTAACFFDGWYQTSDAGLMPGPGEVVVLGRADGMLNIGGVKVPPDPIEAEVKALEGVSDAVVMTVTSANDVAALVVAVETAGQPPPPDLEQRVGTIISRFVGVFTVMPWEVFPRTDSGKPRRQELEDAFRRRG